MNEVAKSALGLEPYGVSFGNGLTDEVFDYMFDETDGWVVEHKLPKAIESMTYMIERSGLEEVHTQLSSEILCSMTDYANYMCGVCEEAYSEALSLLSILEANYPKTDDVVVIMNKQLKHGNFDDWYKYHVENQVPMNELVGILDQLGCSVDELNK